MPIFGDEFHKSQIGRAVAVYFEPPEGGRRRKPTVRHGILIGVEGLNLVIQLPGDEYPLYIEEGADQPVYATREGRWWTYVGPQRA